MSSNDTQDNEVDRDYSQELDELVAELSLDPASEQVVSEIGGGPSFLYIASYVSTLVTLPPLANLQLYDPFTGRMAKTRSGFGGRLVMRERERMVQMIRQCAMKFT